MKSIYGAYGAQFDKPGDDLEFLGRQSWPAQPVFVNKKEDFLSPHLFPDSFSHSENLSQRNDLRFSVQGEAWDIPCCSSQITYDNSLCNNDLNYLKNQHITEQNKEIYGNQSCFYFEKEAYLDKDSEFKKSIVSENVSFFPKENFDTYTPSMEDYSLQSFQEVSHLKSLEEENNSLSINFCRWTIRDLAQIFGFEQNNCAFSQGMYDYNKVQTGRLVKFDKEMEIEVSDARIVSFDKQLILPDSYRHTSTNTRRKNFQREIRTRINRSLKNKSFSSFVRLSLGEGLGDDNSYTHWKKSVLNDISKISKDLEEEILKSDFGKGLGKIRGGTPYVENHTNFCGRILIRRIMRHALFSGIICVNGELKSILISRASMSYFLNKYSDYFLKKLNTCNSESILTKRMGGSYASWKNLKKEAIRSIIDSDQMNFDELLKSDYERIRKTILILESTGFRPLMEHEFFPFICFITFLVNFKGHSGITERACRHFYEEQYNKRCKSETNNDVFSNGQNELTWPVVIKKEEESERDFYANLEKIEIKTKKEVKKSFFEEEKKNFFKMAESYRRLIRSFLNDKRDENFSVSFGIYDYRRVQYIRNTFSETDEVVKIELTDDDLITFDPFLIKSLFSRHPFSVNLQRRMFQEQLREKLDENLRESIFTDFLAMSVPGSCEKKTYSSWKESVIEKLRCLCSIVSEDVFGKDISEWKKGTGEFIDRYLSYCAKSLIRESLRCGLFLVRDKTGGNSKNFFVSRIYLSQLFNKYSDHFINNLAEYSKNNSDLQRGGKSSYMNWKELKKEKINEIIKLSQSSFKKIVELDHPIIAKKVLIFKKNGFREMLDEEFQALINLIHFLAESDTNESFSDSALRHFYREACLRKKYF